MHLMVTTLDCASAAVNVNECVCVIEGRKEAHLDARVDCIAIVPVLLLHVA